MARVWLLHAALEVAGQELSPEEVQQWQAAAPAEASDAWGAQPQCTAAEASAAVAAGGAVMLDVRSPLETKHRCGLPFHSCFLSTTIVSLLYLFR